MRDNPLVGAQDRGIRPDREPGRRGRSTRPRASPSARRRAGSWTRCASGASRSAASRRSSGEPALLAALQAVVRTTNDWTVPGKPHFFKAIREDEARADHPILKAGLHPKLLEGRQRLLRPLHAPGLGQHRADQDRRVGRTRAAGVRGLAPRSRRHPDVQDLHLA
ncbi:MAG: hypothetical protein WDM92_13430 [Caulobacteraceae bacterium]